MPGGSKGHKREAALAALLSEPTVEAAAGKAGVSYRTLKRWLAEEEFCRRFREAQRLLLEQAVARMLALGGRGVDTLARNLDCGKPGAENRAAALLLTLGPRGLELADLAERVEALERARELERQQEGRRRR
jgi:hypothetical protein